MVNPNYGSATYHVIILDLGINIFLLLLFVEALGKKIDDRRNRFSWAYGGAGVISSLRVRQTIE